MNKEQLKKWRNIDLMMTQKEFSEWSGYHCRTIQKFEGGERPIPGALKAQYRQWRENNG